jgi:hypothetical protein
LNNKFNRKGAEKKYSPQTTRESETSRSLNLIRRAESSVSEVFRRLLFRPRFRKANLAGGRKIFLQLNINGAIFFAQIAE